MAKKKDKKKKRSTRAVALPRGGFMPPKPTWGTVRGYATRIIKDELRKDGVDIDAISRTLKGARLPSATQLAGKIAGTMYTVSQDYISGAGKKSAPFLQSEGVSTRQIGSVNVKRHMTKFEHGKPNPGTVRQLARLNGTTTYPFLDTRRNSSYGVGSANRDHMTVNGGFNRKTIANFRRMTWNAEDIWDTCNLTNYKTPATKLQTNYVVVKNLWRKVTIVNTSRYLKATYKIKLYKQARTESTAISNVMASGFFTDAELTTGSQIAGKMPIQYQLDGRVSEGVNGAVKVWVDPKASMLDSPEIAAEYDIVKTFTKTLGPGDSWDYHEIMHTGSGINIDQMKAVRTENGENELGFALCIEATGQEVAACYAANSNENFIGTAPIYYQVEFSRGGEFVNNPHNTNSGFTATAAGGVVSSNFLVRSFTNYRDQESLTSKIFNVPISDITDDPTLTAAGKLFIPIMSDSNVVYAQRAREGGTGGDEN